MIPECSLINIIYLPILIYIYIYDFYDVKLVLFGRPKAPPPFGPYLLRNFQEYRQRVIFQVGQTCVHFATFQMSAQLYVFYFLIQKLSVVEFFWNATHEGFWLRGKCLLTH